MKTLILLFLFNGLLLATAIVFVVIGLVRKRALLLGVGIGLFFLLFCVGGYTVYRATSGAYRHVSGTFAPRSGMEIYTALFGKPEPGCVKVLHHQDQVIPRIDDAIRLHVSTCPAELSRILSLQEYILEILPASEAGMAGPDWFHPEQLGDSVEIFSHLPEEHGSAQQLFVNRAHTEAYVLDIAD